MHPHHIDLNVNELNETTKIATDGNCFLSNVKADDAIQFMCSIDEVLSLAKACVPEMKTSHVTNPDPNCYRDQPNM